MSMVKVNIDVENGGNLLTGDCKPADLGTRTTSPPKELVAGSEYEESMGCMTKPESERP